MSFQGKGSKERPLAISRKERDLRYELVFAKPKRKEEIKKELEKLKNEI